MLQLPPPLTPLQILLLNLLTDTIPGDRTTTATVTVGGAHVFSTLNTLGDFDFFKVQLTAGQTYEYPTIQVVGVGRQEGGHRPPTSSA